MVQPLHCIWGPIEALGSRLYPGRSRQSLLDSNPMSTCVPLLFAVCLSCRFSNKAPNAARGPQGTAESSSVGISTRLSHLFPKLCRSQPRVFETSWPGLKEHGPCPAGVHLFPCGLEAPVSCDPRGHPYSLQGTASALTIRWASFLLGAGWRSDM